MAGEPDLFDELEARSLQVRPGPRIGPPERLTATMALSAIAFGVLILGVGFTLDDPAPVMPTLDVILTRKIAGTERQVADTVLSNVRVLAVDQTFKQDDKGEQVAQGKRGRERSESGGHGLVCHTRPEPLNPNRASRTNSAQRQPLLPRLDHRIHQRGAAEPHRIGRRQAGLLRSARACGTGVVL